VREFMVNMQRIIRLQGKEYEGTMAVIEPRHKILHKTVATKRKRRY
jgi:hypothetical protein